MNVLEIISVLYTITELQAHKTN